MISGALFHFSEDPALTRFVPHVPRTNPTHPPAVWAIDERHAPLYWFPRDRMRTTTIYRYELDPADFSPWNDASGQWVCDHEIAPLSVAPIGDLVTLHRDAGIELRVVDSLWPLRDLAHRGPWDFSTVRMGNAWPREHLA